MVYEKHPVEVVDLVAHRPGHEPLAPHLPLLAVAVEVAQADALRAGDDLYEVGDGEAALFLRHLPFRGDDLRVDEDVQLARPTPGAAYMVSIMSSISFWSGSSISTTGWAGRRRTSAPYFTIGRTATSSPCMTLNDEG